MSKKKNDDRIKKFMTVVEEKKVALGAKPRAAWKTTGIFKYVGRQDVNINTVSNVRVLVEVLALILTFRTGAKEACEILGTEYSEAEHQGHSLEEWITDFKLRASMIKWDDKKKELNALEKQLGELISEDAKTDMALDDISNTLG